MEIHSGIGEGGKNRCECFTTRKTGTNFTLGWREGWSENKDKAFVSKLATKKDTKHERDDTRTSNTEAQKMKTCKGKTMNGTLQHDDRKQSDCICSNASVGMCDLERKCRQLKEHNQTPQTFTEARLYLSKKGNRIWPHGVAK